MVTKKEDSEEIERIKLESSKSIKSVKKVDTIKVDDMKLEVDAHHILIDHGSTKEMVIECFDPKTDKDYEIRYFDDQMETSIEVYRFDEIIYNRLPSVKKISW